MNNTVLKAPVSVIKDFDTLFIELSVKSCNLRCKHCYIDFTNAKNVKNFIHIDKIKEALSDLKDKKLKYIHLTGAEPMLHPDFNSILRLCLKYYCTVIHTNAYSINDKKARFLKRVQEENNKNNEIVIKMSFEHYDEKTNDEIRGRGSYRKGLHAIQSLVKYDFNPLITVVNHFNEDERVLRKKFAEVFSSIGFEIEDINLNIIPLVNKTQYADITPDLDKKYTNLDCSFGRTLTINGVYNCPLTTEDYRGHSGCSFKDYRNFAGIDTPSCSYCISADKRLFGIGV